MIVLRKYKIKSEIKKSSWTPITKLNEAVKATDDESIDAINEAPYDESNDA